MKMMIMINGNWECVGKIIYICIENHTGHHHHHHYLIKDRTENVLNKKNIDQFSNKMWVKYIEIEIMIQLFLFCACACAGVRVRVAIFVIFCCARPTRAPDRLTSEDCGKSFYFYIYIYKYAQCNNFIRRCLTTTGSETKTKNKKKKNFILF